LDSQTLTVIADDQVYAIDNKAPIDMPIHQPILTDEGSWFNYPGLDRIPHERSVN
jgi:hypothetical protein